MVMRGERWRSDPASTNEILTSWAHFIHLNLSLIFFPKQSARAELPPPPPFNTTLINETRADRWSFTSWGNYCSWFNSPTNRNIHARRTRLESKITTTFLLRGHRGEINKLTLLSLLTFSSTVSPFRTPEMHRKAPRNGGVKHNYEDRERGALK